jgi:murein DD-endopeptidase MepM/ murein hydrolase activator NlpD
MEAALRHHVVRRGESLSGIAHHYGVSWQKLAHRNGLLNPNTLRVGQLLSVPGQAESAPPHRAPKGSPGQPPRPAPTLPAPVPGGPATAVAGDVTDAQLRAIMPTAGTLVARYLGPLNNAMRSYGIDTNERRAAFLAQISVES